MNNLGFVNSTKLLNKDTGYRVVRKIKNYLSSSGYRISSHLRLCAFFILPTFQLIKTLK